MYISLIFYLCFYLNFSALLTKEFHIIHINYYCETDTRHFIPAEIAIAKFSLGEGVIDTLHKFVSPGKFITRAKLIYIYYCYL